VTCRSRLPSPSPHRPTANLRGAQVFALENLEKQVRKPNARVLDVGSGSGYLTACFAAALGPGGKVRRSHLFSTASRTLRAEG
jgi:protein-L-isoaspartate(D-aspartate) O-methyltransferase